jgi:hypothetical protein
MKIARVAAIGFMLFLIAIVLNPFQSKEAKCRERVKDLEMDCLASGMPAMACNTRVVKGYVRCRKYREK